MPPALGRYFLGISMVAFGVQHLVYGEWITRVAPRLPDWLSGHAMWAGLLGLALLAAGVALITGRGALIAARLLGVGLLGSALLLHLPLALAQPLAGGLWTNVGKALALSGGALVLAGRLAAPALANDEGNLSASGGWDRFTPLGRYFYSVFLVLCGVQHFIYPQFVAMLVPAWIGGATFWTYFAGIALIAGGVGIVSAAAPRLAALLTGAMIFAWLLVLHLPRALANLHDANETTAVFEALALSGIGFLLAAAPAPNAARPPPV